MRKYMNKEVKYTTIRLAKLEMDMEGKPVATELEPITLMGTLTPKQVQRLVLKDYGKSVTPYKIDHFSKIFRMKVTDYISLAEEYKPPKQNK